MGLKEFFKNAAKKRIVIEVIAGGHKLTDKKLTVPLKNALMVEGAEHGQVVMEIPFASKISFKLDRIEWEESATRSGGKAAIGAIVGSLAGPVGTIAGAAIGGRKKDNSKAFVYLIDEKTGEEITIHIRCDEKTYTEISMLM